MLNQQLARWISIGLKHPVTETTGAYLKYDLDRGYCGCALGLALVGKLGSPYKALLAYDSLRRNDLLLGDEKLAVLLGIPRHLASHVSQLHKDGRSAHDIITALDANEVNA